MAHQDDLKVSTLALLSFLGTATVVVIIFAMLVLYLRTADRLEEERFVSQPYAELNTALADQQARLVEYALVGTVEENGMKKTVYRVPIDRAMQQVLNDWKTGALPGPPATGKPDERAAGPEATKKTGTAKP
jgi:hypothetical protein